MKHLSQDPLHEIVHDHDMTIPPVDLSMQPEL